jgi:hypothetical protein
MSDLTPRRLGELITEALERIAFVITEPCDESDLPLPFSPTQRARISIGGVGRATVWLEADDGFLCEFAAGLLGCDPDEVDPTAAGRDALSELANIIGGSVVVALGGTDREYRLGLPQALDPAADPVEVAPIDRDDAVHCLLASDEGAIRACFRDESAAGDGPTDASATPACRDAA